jgi:hypothetical protein
MAGIRPEAAGHYIRAIISAVDPMWPVGPLAILPAFGKFSVTLAAKKRDDINEQICIYCCVRVHGSERWL